MPAEYEIGQKVIITPAKGQGLSTRDSDLQQYAGMTGEITNYYWIQPPAGKVFYLYTVQTRTGKEIALYGDEMQRIQTARSSPRSPEDE